MNNHPAEKSAPESDKDFLKSLRDEKLRAGGP